MLLAMALGLIARHLIAAGSGHTVVNGAVRRAGVGAENQILFGSDR